MRRFREALVIGALAGICALSASTIAHAQEAIELKAKNDAVKSYKETVAAKFEQTLTIAGMEINNGVEASSTKTYALLPADDKGNIGVKVTTNSQKADYEFPGFSFSFDSANPKPREDANPLAKGIIALQQAVSKAELVYRIDPKGNVLSAEGGDKILEEAPEDIRKLAESQLKPESLRSSFAARHEFLPDKPVKPGDKWTRKSQSDLGMSQLMALTVDYKYVGEEKRGDRTLDKIEGTVTAVTLTQEPNPMATIEKSDLKPTESKITLYFDRAKGLRTESEMMVRIEGELTISVMGQQLDAKIKLQIDNTAKIAE